MLTIQTVLHPTDFSDCSDYAFRLACSLARDSSARVVVLHVVAPEVCGAGRVHEREQTREQLRETLLQLEARDPEVWVEHLLVEGDPATQILLEAQALKCDLVVMGTHGRMGAAPVMGSVAEEVVRRAVCPVVTVRSSARQPLSGDQAPDKAVRPPNQMPRQDGGYEGVHPLADLVVADQDTD